MRTPKLRWQLFFSFLLIVAVCLGAFAWYASSSVNDLYQARLRQNLEAEARLIRSRLVGPARRADKQEVDRLCRELGTVMRGRVTVILPSGEILGDSLRAPERMKNWSTYPEVRRALRGKVSVARRKSSITGHPRMYLALPLDGEDVGVLRLGVPAASPRAGKPGFVSDFALAAAVLMGVAVLIFYLASRRILKPLEKLRRGAKHIARGDLRYRLPVPETPELMELANTLNGMTDKLRRSMRDETQQRGKLRSILDSMEEGVMAVGRNGRILDLNPAAAGLLNVPADDARGKTIYEVARNARLQRFIDRVLGDRESHQIELDVERGEQVRLRVRVSSLRDADGNYLGGLFILQDMTRIRQLERVRKDFVANVTHELKTPITSIQGFVETLLEGAYEDPESAERFLRIIDRQIGRLSSIIEDLLVLSSMEERRDRSELDVETVTVEKVIQSAVEVCARRAEEMNVRIRQDVPPGLTAEVNAALVEQAVVNLVDNAVKYSDEGGVVDISGRSDDGGVCIKVRDRGCGIPEDEQNRIFERFYRVGKARSREKGGTGLGLSIVSHVVDMHGGQLRVDSAPGQGSIFTICFPG